MIDPNNIQAIQLLKQDQIAFPEIDYLVNEPLNLPATTLLAAYTNIANNVDPVLLEGLDWNHHGDIAWQNQMLQTLFESIIEMINHYHNNLEDGLLLTKIFVWIQLWGGNSGRSPFVRGRRWPENFNLNIYSAAINFILQNDFHSALATLNRMFGIKTPFATKHIHFWCNAEAPIYDSIIAAIVFGRKPNQVSAGQYQPYMDALDALIVELNNDQLTRSSIERSLFNWANTPLGLQWRNLRLQ
jgi:hypothetical protein